MKTLLKRIGSYWNKPGKAAYVFIAPAVVLLTVFTFIPLVGTLVFGFFDMNIFFKDTTFIGFDNFIRFFGDSRAINSLLHTLYFALWQVPLQLVVSLLLAVALQKSNWFNKLCRSVLFIPVVCSLTAVSIIWSVLLNENIGYLPYLLSKIGVESPAFLSDARLALPVVAIITVWKNFGMTMMILLSGIQSISSSLYEAAEIDGAGARQKFFRITIPQLLPSIGFCLLTTFIASMQVFDQVFLMTGGGPQFKTETAVQYIYVRGFSAPYELGYASAVSWVLFVIIAVIAVLQNRFMAHKEAQYNN